MALWGEGKQRDVFGGRWTHGKCKLLSCLLNECFKENTYKPRRGHVRKIRFSRTFTTILVLEFPDEID